MLYESKYECNQWQFSNLYLPGSLFHQHQSPKLEAKHDDSIQYDSHDW